MMDIGLNVVINCIAKKEGFVVKIDLDKHVYKVTRYKGQDTRYKAEHYQRKQFPDLAACRFVLISLHD